MKVEQIIDRLAILRKKANLSGRKLSRLLGMTDGYITRIEDYCFIPSLKVFMDILDIFQISPTIFFSDSFISYLNNNKNIEQMKSVVAIALKSLEE